MRFAAVLAVTFVVSACGVKSSPAQPEWSTYPRTYPAEPSVSAKTKPAAKQTAPYATPGAYQPPPPATQMPR